MKEGDRDKYMVSTREIAKSIKSMRNVSRTVLFL